MASDCEKHEGGEASRPSLQSLVLNMPPITDCDPKLLQPIQGPDREKTWQKISATPKGWRVERVRKRRKSWEDERRREARENGERAQREEDDRKHASDQDEAQDDRAEQRAADSAAPLSENVSEADIVKSSQPAVLEEKHDDETPPARRGRRRNLDAFAKGKVSTLLGLGASQRQAAAVVGVDQSVISRELERDPDFAAEVDDASSNAEVLPLLRIAQASHTSWRAAAWLINYLQNKSYVPKTPEQEADEFERFCRALDMGD